MGRGVGGEGRIGERRHHLLQRRPAGGASTGEPAPPRVRRGGRYGGCASAASAPADAAPLHPPAGQPVLDILERQDQPVVGPPRGDAAAPQAEAGGDGQGLRHDSPRAPSSAIRAAAA